MRTGAAGSTAAVWRATPGGCKGRAGLRCTTRARSRVAASRRGVDAEQPAGSRGPALRDDDCQGPLGGECRQRAWAGSVATSSRDRSPTRPRARRWVGVRRHVGHRRQPGRTGLVRKSSSRSGSSSSKRVAGAVRVDEVEVGGGGVEVAVGRRSGSLWHRPRWRELVAQLAGGSGDAHDRAGGAGRPPGSFARTRRGPTGCACWPPAAARHPPGRYR